MWLDVGHVGRCSSLLAKLLHSCRALQVSFQFVVHYLVSQRDAKDFVEWSRDFFPPDGERWCKEGHLAAWPPAPPRTASASNSASNAKHPC